MEIALTAGYESQQAFTAIFKEMYNKTPGQYRKEKTFYPLQLRCILHRNPMTFEKLTSCQHRIMPAAPSDIPQWMRLVRLVVDGFPYLDEESYMARLQEYIARNRFIGLGFVEAELLVEYGYPTQRLILPGEKLKEIDGL